jgi:hypothetical protein
VAPRHDRDSIAPTLNQAGVGSRVLLGIAVSVAARPANKFRCACVGWRVRTVHDEGHGSLAVSRSRPRMRGCREASTTSTTISTVRSASCPTGRYGAARIFRSRLSCFIGFSTRTGRTSSRSAMTSMFFYGPNDSNDIEDFHRWTTPTVLQFSWQGLKLLADSHQPAGSPDQRFRRRAVGLSHRTTVASAPLFSLPTRQSDAPRSMQPCFPASSPTSVWPGGRSNLE